MSEKTWHVIGRGKAGWFAQGLNVRSSGGDLNPYTYWTGEKCGGYVGEAVEGCFAYDAENAPDEVYVEFVLSGPMVDPKLGPEEVDSFTQKDRETAARMMSGLGGGYKTLAAVAQDEKYGGLDRVGVGIYERLLRQIPGIKFGRVHNGAIVWE